MVRAALAGSIVLVFATAAGTSVEAGRLAVVPRTDRAGTLGRPRATDPVG